MDIESTLQTNAKESENVIYYCVVQARHPNDDGKVTNLVDSGPSGIIIQKQKNQTNSYINNKY